MGNFWKINWKDFFCGPRSLEKKEAFEKELVKAFRLPIYIILPLSTLLEIFNIINVVFLREVSITTLNNQIYFSLYCFLLLVNIISILILLTNKVKSASLFLKLGFVYAVCISIWCTGITLMDLRNNTNVNVYTITMIGIAILFYLKPVWAVSAIGGNHLLFLLLYLLKGDCDGGIIINSSVIALIGICIAISRYHTKWTEFESREIIVRQNRQITRMLEQMNHLAITDALTETYNRRFLETVLREKWEKNCQDNLPAGVAMLDIDDFKKYNDRFGHQAGDNCLHKISEIMKETLTGLNDYLIRYGGEEFCFIFLNRSKEEVCAITDKIRHRISLMHLEEDAQKEKAVTVSIGVCYDGQPKSNELEYLIQMSDRALYRAKNEGKNRVVCTEKQAGNSEETVAPVLE